MYLTGVSVQRRRLLRESHVLLSRSALRDPVSRSRTNPDTAQIEDGSGNRVEVAGNAFLVVKLMPAMTAKIDGDQVTKTYTGPSRVKSDVPSFIQEIVKTGDFESTVTWVIGLDRERPFKANAGTAGLGIAIDGS